MSIYIRYPVKKRECKYLKNRINYILDPNSMNNELILARGVVKTTNVDTVYRDMLFIKKIFGKADKRPYLHWLLSFDEGVDTEIAYKVGEEVIDLIYKYYKRQVIGAVHINTDNRHVHYIINTVSFTDGKMFSEGRGGLYKFRTKLNKILEKNGLLKVGNIDIREEEE